MASCWYIESYAPPFQNPNSMIPVQDHEVLQIDPEPNLDSVFGQEPRMFH